MSWLIVFISYLAPIVLLAGLLIMDQRYGSSRLRRAAVVRTRRSGAI
jgi:hypothetical protein